MKNQILFYFVIHKAIHIVPTSREFAADRQLRLDCYTKAEYLSQ